MATKIYDNSPYRRGPTEWDDAFFQYLLNPIIAPAFIVVGIYLCGNAYMEYRQIESSSGWSVVPGNLISVNAPVFRSFPLEPDVIFFKDASLDYSYKFRGKTYFNRQKLAPAGPRFYSSIDNFSQSGDCARDNDFDNRMTRKYPQIASNKPVHTPLQSAEHFKFSSIDNNGTLSVRTDPHFPQSACLRDVLTEHAIRIAQWGLGSLAIGILIFVSRFLLSKTDDVVESEDEVVDRVYDQLFH
ncbi:MAG: hypothetical protein EKK48_04235 [Candidatus Melainabacteria bacterium]|nr:MAG: hypothetical protein EKK48_04235 [Candidatus Melainabacteria bacterium]